MLQQLTTRVLTDTAADIETAAAVIKSGGLVAFPTETVYGLGANALDSAAVRRIFAAKGRPADNPLIIHINEKADLLKLVSAIPQKAELLIDTFMPGALTLVLPGNGVIPPEATGGLDTVAVRIPADETARNLLKRSGVPIAAPSANSSGKPSPTLMRHVLDDLDGIIDAVIDGGAAVLGLESTVLDMTEEVPRLLRPGMVTREMLEAVIGNICADAQMNPAKPKSPGMKYKHYAPKAKVILFTPTEANIADINETARNSPSKIGIFTSSDYAEAYRYGKVTVSGSLNDPATIAANLFKSLREFDYLGVDTIYAEIIPESGAGAAVMNRLRKAAGCS